MSEIINAKKLTKIYRGSIGAGEVKALDGVDLSVSSGEFIGIMGPSGSGKTTLLNLLSGVDNSTSGEIFIDGKDITKMKRDELALFRRQKIGYIFQDFNLLDSLSVKENIALPLILDKIEPKEIEKAVDKLLDFFGIGDLANKAPYNISGGQKQRVAAARALVVNPAVCYADEPTGNLDSKSSANIMEMLTQMNEKQHATILMVTHDAFAASYAKRIVFIKDGRITLQINRGGSRREFFDKILETLSHIEEVGGA
jgi:putative ABC transport system ATP-binding protein